jgi:hypothetical protein
MAYQREKDAESRRRYDQRVEEYKTDKAAWIAQRNAVLRKRGFDVPEAPSLPSQARVGGFGQVQPMGGTPPAAAPLTLGTLMGGPGPAQNAPPVAPEGSVGPVAPPTEPMPAPPLSAPPMEPGAPRRTLADLMGPRRNYAPSR